MLTQPVRTECFCAAPLWPDAGLPRMHKACDAKEASANSPLRNRTKGVPRKHGCARAAPKSHRAALRCSHIERHGMFGGVTKPLEDKNTAGASMNPSSPAHAHKASPSAHCPSCGIVHLHPSVESCKNAARSLVWKKSARGGGKPAPPVMARMYVAPGFLSLVYFRQRRLPHGGGGSFRQRRPLPHGGGGSFCDGGGDDAGGGGRGPGGGGRGPGGGGDGPGGGGLGNWNAPRGGGGGGHCLSPTRPESGQKERHWGSAQSKTPSLRSATRATKGASSAATLPSQVTLASELMLKPCWHTNLQPVGCGVHRLTACKRLTRTVLALTSRCPCRRRTFPQCSLRPQHTAPRICTAARWRWR
jgi:hypothetical protein